MSISREIKDDLKQVDFSPLEVVSLSSEPFKKRKVRDIRPDLILVLGWQRNRYRFMVERKRQSTPLTIRAAILQAKAFSNKIDNTSPIIIVPYFGPTALNKFIPQSTSGFDLSVNVF